ncbi:MAG: hypothetical protein FWD97_05395 [Defluviitaleaceae bacterium]|nr:hypothetical protein [Defluviitaleaceae bacterium]
MSGKLRYFIVIVFALVLAGMVLVAAEPIHDTTQREAAQRWIDYGILPANVHEHLDRHITYQNFALLMEALLGYELDEKFTFNSGLMYIRRNEAFNILQTAIGHRPTTFHVHGGFLTFGDFAEILNQLIQIYITDDFNLNLADELLDGTLIINHRAVYVDALVSNVSGDGHIVIVGRYENTIFLDSVDILGNITITASRHGMAYVDIRNSRASALNILGEATVNFIGDTEVEGVNIYAPAMLNTSLLFNRADAPSVRLSTADVALVGRFGNVDVAIQQTNAPVMISAEGRITNLQSDNAVVLLGDVTVETYQAPALNVINQAGFYRNQEIAAAIEFGIHMAMSYFMEQLLDAIANATPGEVPRFDFVPPTPRPPQTSEQPQTPPQITPPPVDPPPVPY